MNITLQTLCEDFIRNRDTVKAAFRWESSYIYPVCASIFTDRRVKADTDKLYKCRDILKARTGAFSNFRGNPRLAVISMMALEDAPEERLDRALRVFDSLRSHFSNSQYLPVASMVIAGLTEPGFYEECAARTRQIFELMRAEHPFLTSGEDSVFAALLALSELDEQAIVEQTECCYRILKGSFFSPNAVQSLSHVLALCDGDPEEKCARTLELQRAIRDRGCLYGTGYELATLGVLAMLPGSRDALVDDLVETDAFLSRQKGYGIFGPGKKMRLMHAGMIVTSDRMSVELPGTMQSVAMSAAISLAAAQQAALCAALAATAAAQSASN